jgi:SAM-dependent methyltransferase
MPDVGQNLKVWESDWDWSAQGDEWSSWWGGTEALWHGAILPRIHAFVPTATILEIAPGYGRWTEFLKDLSERLVIVDLAERCIAACRQRFADSTNIEYHVNDGRSLEMVPDGSIDFAFSFDSLVHVEQDVLAAYLAQLSTKLTAEGVGFFHHSNAGAYPRLLALTKRMPGRLRRRLVARGALIDLGAWRAESVTAEGFAERCGEAGLACVSQEKVNWEHGPFLTDAFSIFARTGSSWNRPRTVVRNPLFREEAKRMSRLYAGVDSSRA